MAVTDPECVRFLQWVLPKMGMRWKGFRKVRRQVCRRIRRRLASLGLSDLDQYRVLLGRDSSEWESLLPLLRVTISRFYRDRAVFNAIRWRAFPYLIQEVMRDARHRIECWSAGCSSGEEAYTLSLIWGMLYRERFPGIEPRVVGTDIDGAVLERARNARYPSSSLRELPLAWIERGFTGTAAEGLQLNEEFRRLVRFELQDIRRERPGSGFDIILCRYLVFTYFDTRFQLRMLERFGEALRPGGLLVIGMTEGLPENSLVTPWIPGARIFRFR